MAKKNKKIIIAGPCAIETKRQFFETLEKIYKYADVIRCGAWKARTSPNSYSGQGEKSLEWIQEAQEKYNICCAIEVGTEKHINLALKYKVRNFWIGARTTSNPFAVEEISQNLKNKNVEVWIKNPIFPDLKLWIGAIERFQKNKINSIKLIHRGFFLENTRKYRNHPRWDLLEKIQEKYPNVPVICDPSHIAGKRALIQGICEKALDYQVDGFMIEVHHKPNEALSDAQQQLCPKQFKKLLLNLNLK